MTEPKEVFESPIEVTNEKGNVILSVGEDVNMGDGRSAAINLAGTPYETVLFAYRAPLVEEIEDFGYAAVVNAFRSWAEGIINDEDFYSIEWRFRPKLERTEIHVDATIVDATTGKHRRGLEVMQAVSIRARLIVHKRSSRPDTGFIGNREGSEPVWLTSNVQPLKWNAA